MRAASARDTDDLDDGFMIVIAIVVALLVLVAAAAAFWWVVLPLLAVVVDAAIVVVLFATGFVARFVVPAAVDRPGHLVARRPIHPQGRWVG